MPVSRSLSDLMSEFYSHQDQKSSSIRGTATAPVAGTAIATLAAPAAGLYRITVMARYGGTADVIDNMDLRVGGVTVVALPVLPVVNSEPLPVTLNLELNGAQAVTVNAVATGGAGSVFVAHIIATKIGEA